MRTIDKTLLDGVDATVSVDSAALEVANITRVCATIQSGSGTDLTGCKVTLQGSNDVPPSTTVPYTPNANSWVDIPNATATFGATDKCVTTGVAQTCFRYVRAKYTATGTPADTVTVRLRAMGWD